MTNAFVNRLVEYAYNNCYEHRPLLSVGRIHGEVNFSRLFPFVIAAYTWENNVTACAISWRRAYGRTIWSYWTDTNVQNTYKFARGPWVVLLKAYLWAATWRIR